MYWLCIGQFWWHRLQTDLSGRQWLHREYEASMDLIASLESCDCLPFFLVRCSCYEASPQVLMFFVESIIRQMKQDFHLNLLWCETISQSIEITHHVLSRIHIHVQFFLRSLFCKHGSVHVHCAMASSEVDIQDDSCATGSLPLMYIIGLTTTEGRIFCQIYQQKCTKPAKTENPVQDMPYLLASLSLITKSRMVDEFLPAQDQVESRCSLLQKEDTPLMATF